MEKQKARKGRPHDLTESISNKRKLLYRLKSVKPLSKEQAKQRDRIQENAPFARKISKFQNFHGGGDPFVGEGHPRPSSLPHSWSLYVCALLRFENS